MKILLIVQQDLSCYVFYVVVKIFVTTMWRHNHFKSVFLFIRSCNFNLLKMIDLVSGTFLGIFIWVVDAISDLDISIVVPVSIWKLLI